MRALRSFNFLEKYGHGESMQNSLETNENRSPIKSALLFIGLAIFATAVPTASSAEELSVQEWVDQFVATCVGSGSSDMASGEVGADGDISLKKLTLSGTVKGQVQITHKEARLLSDGINNSMSQVAADQAVAVRECLKPIRSILLNIMQNQFAQSGVMTSNTYILTPEEDKIVNVLSNTKGYFGKVGEAVSESTIKNQTKMGDIRFNSAMRRLEEKGYAFEGLILEGDQTISLGTGGEEYALSVGFAN